MPAAGSAEGAGARAYVFGVVPQLESRATFETWQPLMAFLSKATGLRIQLAGTTGISAFEQALAEGAYDFAYMNPYHLLTAGAKQGYRPMLRDGDVELQGILVVRKDSPIRNVEQLAGKTLVFPAPNALGASLLPRAHLRNRLGLSFNSRFVDSHSSVYLNVALGISPAGGGVIHTLRQQPTEVSERLRILYRTEKVAPHPFAVHPRVSEAVAEKVRNGLKAMLEDEECAALMARIPVKRFVVARMEDYLPLQNLRLQEMEQ